jgi:hypothetical protein
MSDSFRFFSTQTEDNIEYKAVLVKNSKDLKRCLKNRQREQEKMRWTNKLVEKEKMLISVHTISRIERKFTPKKKPITNRTKKKSMPISVPTIAKEKP